MATPIRDGVGFQAFDQLVAHCIQGSGPRVARCRQIVAANALGGFMHLWDESVRRGDPSPGSDGQRVVTNFGTFHPKGPSFRLSIAAWLGGLRTGLLALGAALIASLVPARRQLVGRHTLLVGTAAGDCFRYGSDQRFVEFCRRGPVSRLHSPNRLAVQCAGADVSSSDPLITYFRRPLFGLLRASDLSASRRLWLTLAIVQRTVRSLFATCVDRWEGILLRDVVESEVIRALVEEGKLERIIITNSSASSQPLWMRCGAVPCSMIWYSENSKWIWQLPTVVAELPMYSHLSVSEHWVWTSSHAAWLRRLGQAGPIHVVGPILWYLPQRSSVPVISGVHWITVFDITPVTASRAKSLGLIDNPCSAERCIDFLRGIVAAVARVRDGSNLDIRIRIKPKRIQPHMDRAYSDALDALMNEGTVEVMDPKADLFDLVQSSAISIVQPFSSPALVAAHMNARACYFDASARLRVPEHLDPTIRFVQDVTSLERVIRDAVAAKTEDWPATIPP